MLFANTRISRVALFWKSREHSLYALSVRTSTQIGAQRRHSAHHIFLVNSCDRARYSSYLPPWQARTGHFGEAGARSFLEFTPWRRLQSQIHQQAPIFVHVEQRRAGARVRKPSSPAALSHHHGVGINAEGKRPYKFSVYTFQCQNRTSRTFGANTFRCKHILDAYPMKQVR